MSTPEQAAQADRDRVLEQQDKARFYGGLNQPAVSREQADRLAQTPAPAKPTTSKAA